MGPSTRRVAAVACVLASGAFAGPMGIQNTPHDMSAGSLTPAMAARALTETQLCIHCHTPHGAQGGDLLWQRATPVWTRGWAVLTTATGTLLPADISMESKRCLSCHDGTIALGEVNNRGEGAPGVIEMTRPVPRPVFLVGNGPAGNEMLNNHPVSIPYAGQTYNGMVSGAQARGGLGDYYPPTEVACRSPSGFCTGASTLGVFINLRGDTFGRLGIECNSCHEPHNRYGHPSFLRAPMDASALCQACHNM